MSVLQTWCSHWNVALLAEGVDRNIAPLRHLGKNALSPSSRRAWIEIPEPCAPAQNKSKRRHDPVYGPRRLLLQGSFACSTQAQYPGSG